MLFALWFSALAPPCLAAHRLQIAEVRRIADAHASKRADFQMFRIRCFLFDDKEGEWNVLYIPKARRNSDHFSVRVDDKTRKAVMRD